MRNFWRNLHSRYSINNKLYYIFLNYKSSVLMLLVIKEGNFQKNNVHNIVDSYKKLNSDWQLYAHVYFYYYI
jgi:hypothetical protein